MKFVTWILYIGAWIAAIMDSTMSQQAFMPLLARYVVFFSLGVQGLWAAMGHLMYPEKAAGAIGWKTSPFQTEMGGANLGLGVVGVCALFLPNWILPVSVFGCILYGVAVFTHIREHKLNNNTAANNSGPMLYCTIATILTLIVTQL